MRSLLGPGLLLFLITAPLIGNGSEPWRGNVEVIDGVTWTRNPPRPVHPVETVRARELWRIDSDSEELLFGTVAKITRDHRGNFYLLDGQLNELSMLNPEGEFIRRIGGVGEGPGELQNPNSVFCTPDGDIGMTQYFPGKIVMISPTGDPLQDHPIPRYDVGGRVFIGSARQGSEYLAVSTSVRIRQEDGSTDYLDALVAIDREGTVVARYHENNFLKTRDDARYVEQASSNIRDPHWDLGSEDRVYLSNSWERYEIQVYDRCGELERVITREFEPVRRPTIYRDNLQESWDDHYRGRTRRGIPITYRTSDTFRTIQQITTRDDGDLWVLTGQVYNDRDDHIATFDVFDGEGVFTRQVEVLGAGDYYEDLYYLCGDILLVVTNQGEHIPHTAEDVADDEPLGEIICYRIPRGR